MREAWKLRIHKATCGPQQRHKQQLTLRSLRVFQRGKIRIPLPLLEPLQTSKAQTVQPLVNKMSSSTAASSTSRLDGKVALVTGSSRGMGRQNALELASRGASIVICYTSSAAAAEAVIKDIESIGSRAIAIKADVSKPAEIAALFEQALKHFGKLDIVVSNAGVETFGHVSEITPEEFDRVFAVNTRGQLLVAQQAYTHLEEGGWLGMLSSLSAPAKGVSNHVVYSGSKAAVEAFARCLAVGMSPSCQILFLIFARWIGCAGRC